MDRKGSAGSKLWVHEDCLVVHRVGILRNRSKLDIVLLALDLRVHQ